jgi:acyl-[acyl-carrier-protein]-phospholipid O-acyltransferase/long-chain-fatty-acid--[acyl-carrier-protein] ligase
LGVKAAYHADPRDARGVGEMVEKYKATVLMATPTFLRLYCRRCTREQFASLDWVLAAAEKLPGDVAATFERRFGVAPVEGYGCSELSPVVALNVPESRVLKPGTCMNRAGTVGRPLPGMELRVVDPETYEPVPEREEGLLLVKGPNVMLGYWQRPDLTAEAVRDGWYVTGDIVRIEDGFIRITDRLSRFSKLSGEMVPHLRIEEALAELLPQAEHPTYAVTAVPDARKGERLVVLHTGLPRPATEIVRQLREMGLPNLWIPGSDSFFEVQEIPILGSGKIDLKGARQVALECVQEHRGDG